MGHLRTLRRRAAAVALAAGLGVLSSSPPVLAVDAPPTPAASPAAGPTPPAAPDFVRPDSCTSASEEAPVRVEVTTLAPRAPSRVDEPFQVAGRLTNCGELPLTRLQVRLAVGSKIASRSGLARADEEPVLGGRRLPPVRPASDSLAPGAATTFDVRLLVGDLALGRENGVFPLGVQAQARYGEALVRGSVGLASTFVPWFPDGPIAPTRIAWLLPLVDQPRRAPDGALLDDELDALLDSNLDRAGRLHRVLASAREGAKGGCDQPAAPLEQEPAPLEGAPPAPVALCRGEPVPATFAVDPELLGAVESMVRPYVVLERGERRERAASENAVAWLSSLRLAVSTSPVLAVPYADPDVVALSRPESGVRDDIELLRKLGSVEARRVLGLDTLLTSIAWPPPGPIGGSLEALIGNTEAGAAPAIVLDESALPQPPALLGRTPSARTTLSSTTGPVTAMIADEGLSRLIEPDPSSARWQGPRLAEQRWIAEAAAIAAERPSQSRTFLVAPRRRADLLPSVAAAVIADTGRLPWLCPVSLADAVSGTERCAQLPDLQAAVRPENRGTLERRGREDAALAPAYVERLETIRLRSDQFTDEVLVAGGEQAKATKARLLQARGRAESSAWRDKPAGGRAMLALLQNHVDGLRSQIHLVSEPVLLTGSTGTLRLTVENRLDQPVNVGVRLDETSDARLSSEETDVREVPGQQAIQVAVRVEARTSGRFVARARLVDLSGDPFGEPVTLAVRSTRYGRVALGITGAAAAVLLVAAGARITSRALRRPAPRPDPALLDEPVGSDR